MRSIREIRELFDLGLVLKIVLGAFEFLGGILVLVVPRNLVVRIFEFVTQGELAQDPNDAVALRLREFAHSYAIHTHYLVSLYLILRGGIKIVLASLILRGVWIAYPLFIAALALFATYEVYRGMTTASMLLLVLAAYDIILMLLTAYFYQLHEKARTHSSSG